MTMYYYVLRMGAHTLARYLGWKREEEERGWKLLLVAWLVNHDVQPIYALFTYTFAPYYYHINMDHYLH